MLVDAVSDYAMILLDGNGNVVSWNVGAERMTGYSAEEVVGVPYTFLFPEDQRDPERLRRELEALRASGRQVVEGWRIRKNGTRFYAKSIRTTVLDRPGRVCGFAILVHNISEQRELEAQLLQAQKLEKPSTTSGLLRALRAALTEPTS